MGQLTHVWLASTLSLLSASGVALAYTCDTDKTQVWPLDGVIAPTGFLLVEGEGTWRREVEHFPIYRLSFVANGESVRAVASLLSEPGALRAQVTIRASQPLAVGRKYRLKVEASASCVEKPRSDFLQIPRGAATPGPLEWTVRDPTPPTVNQLVMKSVQIVTCAKPPCYFRRLEVAVEGGAASGGYLVLLDIREGDGPKRPLATFGEGDLVSVTENGCNKGTFYDSHGKVCLSGRLISRAGVSGSESAWKCFVAE